MKRSLILLVVMALGNISPANANSKVANIDSFESSYVRCIETRFDNNCWEKSFIGHFDKWQNNETMIITKSREAYLAWLDGHSVFKVHIGPSDKRAGVFESRNYLIERDDGEVIGCMSAIERLSAVGTYIPSKAGLMTILFDHYLICLRQTRTQLNDGMTFIANAGRV